MKERLVPIIGAEGNVGKGIVSAFKNAGWEILPIDPQINQAIEDLSDEEFEQSFSPASITVYTADCGNREVYAENPNLGKENNQRFADFCQRAARVNPDLKIWYIGGSWTKRKPDRSWIINDNSPNKSLEECNPYEKAKISAEENAQKVSSLIRIRYLDWASIVPNFAPNFSIPRMVKQALETGKINYSPGPYGRPLLESVQAGESLLVLIENDSQEQQFTKYLIPGVFILFTNFAQAAKAAVERKTKKTIVLEEIKNTPEFLRTQCKSDYLESLGFTSNKERVLSALKKNAVLVL